MSLRGSDASGFGGLEPLPAHGLWPCCGRVVGGTGRRRLLAAVTGTGLHTEPSARPCAPAFRASCQLVTGRHSDIRGGGSGSIRPAPGICYCSRWPCCPVPSPIPPLPRPHSPLELRIFLRGHTLRDFPHESFRAPKLRALCVWVCVCPVSGPILPEVSVPTPQTPAVPHRVRAGGT